LLRLGSLTDQVARLAHTAQAPAMRMKPQVPKMSRRKPDSTALGSRRRRPFVLLLEAIPLTQCGDHAREGLAGCVRVVYERDPDEIPAGVGLVG